MNKTEFLKKAKAKYKEAVEKKFVSEMNFIFSPTLILRVWFDPNFVPNKKNGETGFMHRWCTVETLPEQISESEEKRLINNLSNCISNNDGIETDRAIIEFLRNADEDTLDEMAHGYEFELGGNKYEIIMWQPLEHFSLRELSEQIDL